MSQPKAKAPKKRKARTWVRWMVVNKKNPLEAGGDDGIAFRTPGEVTAYRSEMIIRVRITEVLPK